MIQDLQKKTRECPGLIDSARFRLGFSGGLALQEFEQSLHLGHDASDFSRFRKQSVFHDTLMHLTQLLTDVTQVTDNLLTLGLRHRPRTISLFPFTPWAADSWLASFWLDESCSENQDREGDKCLRSGQHRQRHQSRQRCMAQSLVW